VLQAKQGSGASEKEVAAEMARILELVDKRRLKDLDTQRLYTMPAAPAAEHDVVVDPDAPDIEAVVEQAPEPAKPQKTPMVAAPQPVADTAAKFAEVLEMFRSKPLG
jgi:hypothetical protein